MKLVNENLLLSCGCFIAWKAARWIATWTFARGWEAADQFRVFLWLLQQRF